MPGRPVQGDGTTRRNRSIHKPTRIMVVMKIMGTRAILILLLSSVKKGMRKIRQSTAQPKGFHGASFARRITNLVSSGRLPYHITRSCP